MCEECDYTPTCDDCGMVTCEGCEIWMSTCDDCFKAKCMECEFMPYCESCGRPSPLPPRSTTSSGTFYN